MIDKKEPARASPSDGRDLNYDGILFKPGGGVFGVVGGFPERSEKLREGEKEGKRDRQPGHLVVNIKNYKRRWGENLR